MLQSFLFITKDLDSKQWKCQFLCTLSIVEDDLFDRSYICNPHGIIFVERFPVAISSLRSCVLDVVQLRPQFEHLGIKLFRVVGLG